MSAVVQFDLGDVERLMRQVESAVDQVPFVMSQLLDDGAFKARQVIVSDTWPDHVHMRNASFITAALRVEKSTKRNLRVEIYDVLNRAHLKLHAEGGIKQGGAHRLALPLPGSVHYTAHGIPASERPAGVIASTPKRALRLTRRGIFVGAGGRLHLRYSFKSSVTQPHDVPFYEDFEYVMRESMRTGFADAMRKAMATRR